MKKIFVVFLTFLAAALAAELAVLAMTKASGWDNFTQGRPFLAAVHVHLLVLGALFFLIQLPLEKSFHLVRGKLYRPFLIVYLSGLTLAVSVMFYKGVCQLFSLPVLRGLTEAGAAIGHTAIFVGLFLFAACLYKAIKNTPEPLSTEGEPQK